MQKSGGWGWTCKVCGKSSMYKRNILNHVEAKHVTTAGVACDVCCKQFKTRDSLRKHMKDAHN